LRLLVLGASGFIGGAVYRLARESHVEVFGTSRRDAAGFVSLQNTSIDEVRRVLKDVCPDVVVNAIGSGVTPGTSSKQEMDHANRLLAESLVSLAMDGAFPQFRLIHLASSRNRSGFHRNDDYVVTKEEATNVMLEALSDGLNGCSLEVFNTYGPGQPEGRLVNLVVRGGIDRSDLILETPSHVRDFVHLDDVAQAVIRVAGSKNSPKQSVEIGTGVPTTVAELAHLAYKLAGADPSLIVTGNLSEPAVVEVADIRPAEEAFGWRADISLRDGLKQMIDLAKA